MDPVIQIAAGDALDALLKDVEGRRDDVKQSVSDPSSIDDSIAACEALIKLATEKLHSYKYEKNASLPLHRLPREIFQRILEMVLEESGGFENTFDCYYSDLLRFRLVSKHWEAFVTSTPPLWHMIRVEDTTDLQSLQMILQHSGSHGLDVQLYPVDPLKASALVNEAMASAYRWRSLELCEFSEEANAPLMLKGTTTALKRLEVYWSDHLNVADTVLKKVTSSLEEICLETAMIPWRACCFTKLVDLTIAHLQPRNAFSLPDFADALRSAPELSTLVCLCWDLPPDSIPTITADPPIHLSNLRTLELNQVCHEFVSWLLGSVVTPALDHFNHPQMPDNDLTVEGYRVMMWCIGSWLEPFLKNRPPLPLRCRITYSDWTEMDFCWVDETGTRQYKIDLVPRGSLEEIVEIGQAFIARFEPSETSLTVSGSRWLSDGWNTTEMLIGMEAYLHNVTSITMGGMLGDELESNPLVLGLAALQDGEQGRRWLYPKVNHLIVRPDCVKRDGDILALLDLVKRRWGPTSELSPTPLLRLGLHERQSDCVSLFQDALPQSDVYLY